MRSLHARGKSRGPAHGWTDESDIAVALIRGAFIIAFALTPHVVGRRLSPDLWTQTVLVVAAVFELALLVSYLRRSPLPLKRPLALVVDLVMVTSAIRFFEQLPVAGVGDNVMRLEWLVAIYYPIIMVAAIWYRVVGAIIVAAIANVLYGVVGLQLPWTSYMLWLGQGPAMLMVAVAASYIVLARDRERRHSDRLENDMALARRLQDTMLPTDVPRIAGADIGVAFEPARTVGGDLYDLIPLGPGRLLLCVGDMAGKSVYGLVHLSLVHSHIQAAARRGMEPAEIAEFVNANVYDALQPDSYSALFLAAINLELGIVSFANCGHLPPVLIKAPPDGQCVELFTGDIVIGGRREQRYRQEVLAFERGDVLVCYTDGVAESRNRHREEFGLERITALVQERGEASAAELARELVAATDQFSADAYRDDRTVLVVRAVDDEVG